MGDSSTLKRFSLAGKGVVLTGAGGHLGTAMTAATLEAGATVVAVGRTEAALAELAEETAAEHADRLITLAGDALDPAVADAAAQRLAAAGAPLRGWVNNAYAASPTLLGELDEAAVRETIEDGLSNVIVACDRIAPVLAETGGGSIVNVASIYGLVSPQPRMYAGAKQKHNPPAYGAAKAGLIQFTRYAAVHWAELGIRVNALTPGPFPAAETQGDEDFIAGLIERVPLGRIGRPEELGGAVVFLLSEASSYMTGQQLVIDGGWTAW